jgi:hypothetical protein
LHLDPEEPSRLLGIWCPVASDGRELAAYYPSCDPAVIAQAALTLEEKVPAVTWPAYFRQLADRIPSNIWWETTDMADTGTDLSEVFVALAAEVLASAAAIHGGTGASTGEELQFTAKMFSVREAERLGMREGTVMKPLDPEFLRSHSVYVASDNAFQQRARLLQARWRERRGLPIGTRNNRSDGEELGSRLAMPFARDSLANFISETAKQRVKDEVESPDRDKERLFAVPRIYCDLLSSQPLCFNLFAELDADRGLATNVLSSMLPGRVQRVHSIQFEYSPGRLDPKYLGNRSAFDVFVDYETPQGGRAFVGIEVKYQENMKVSRATMEGKPYHEVADLAGCFRDEQRYALENPPLQQLWLDHLLALSMRQVDDWESELFVVLAPALNARCASAVADYSACLSDTSTFQYWTLEALHASIAEHSSAEWVEEFFERYLDFDALEDQG